MSAPHLSKSLQLFATQPYNVVAAVGDGKSAIETAEKARPNVALLDISMPEMNGLDAAERIAEAAPEVKIISVTSHAEPAYVEEAFRRGASGYVLKGRIPELMEAMTTVLGGHTHRPQL